jgi:hypothetical protein
VVITINTNKIQSIMRHNFEILYLNKLQNLEEKDRFLDAFDLPKLNQKNTNHLKRTITRNEIKALMKVFQKEKTLWINCQIKPIVTPIPSTVSMN